MVSIREALDIVSRYTDDKKADVGYNVVILRGKQAMATNGEVGCIVPCNDADVGLAVDCAALLKMVKVIGEAEVSKGKRRRLIVSGGGSKFTISAIPKKSEPQMAEIPGDLMWHKLSADKVKAIVGLTGMTGKERGESSYALSGVRFTPDWVAVASSSSLAVAWIAGIVSDPFTAPAELLKDLSGDVSIAVTGNRIFVREETTQQVRWGLGIQAEWPDQTVGGVLGAARDAKGRKPCKLDVDDLAVVTKQADVVSGGTLSSFRMTMRSAEVVIEGKNKMGEAGTSDFSGSMKVKNSKKVSKDMQVGFIPGLLYMGCDAVKASAGDECYMSVAGELDPIVLWSGGGDVITEVLIMPQRLLDW
tara:strand:- start:696 stop:1778 length:1083 start_codon:yes stop_codon:yes gene_type:complete